MRESFDFALADDRFELAVLLDPLGLDPDHALSVLLRDLDLALLVLLGDRDLLVWSDASRSPP